MESLQIQDRETLNIRRSNNTREKILEAASELFLEKGFQATSIEDILEKVDIAKGTFYHHFVSKESLLESVTDSLSQAAHREILSRLENSDFTDPLSRLNALFRISLEWSEENLESMIHLVRALCKETNAFFKYALRKKNRELSHPVFAKIFQDGKQEGLFDIDDPSIASEIVLIILDGLSEQLEADLFSPVRREINLTGMIQFYETSIERVLGLESGKIRLFNWNSYNSIKEKLAKYLPPSTLTT